MSRRLENIFPSKEEAAKALGSGKSLHVYVGIDPTSPHLHIGHSVPLLFLKQLAGLGHKPVFLIGDFTALIGDPTDKEAARTALTKKEVEQNMKTYLDQAYRILPKGSFEIKYNSKWLAKMSFQNVIELASHVTVQQMLARDMFQERIKNEKPIYVHEFLYPLMQGYDSVAMEVDGEVGGNDQTFNMLVGRDLIKHFLGKEKLVFATRLLVDPKTGKKMSKTEGGLIALDDSPEDIFQKVWSSIPNTMIKTVFELGTEKDMSWIKQRSEEAEMSGDYKSFNHELAFELVSMYHGEKAAGKARDEWRQPEIMKLPEGSEGKILDVLQISGLASSASVGRRLIEENAVSVDGKTIEDVHFKVKKGDILEVGKNRPIKIE